MDGIFELNIKNYWNYYLELEKEVLETRKFVEFDKKNYNCFSIEFLKLYQAICSEIDTLGRYLAGNLIKDFNPNNGNIYRWWDILSNNLFLSRNIVDGWNNKKRKINIKNYKVLNHIFYQNIKPWKIFEERQCTKKNENILRSNSSSSASNWWSDYNSVKHNRTIFNKSKRINYYKANLKNVIYSLAALYVLEIALLQQFGNKNNLQSFINKSEMFEKNSFLTAHDVVKICK